LAQAKDYNADIEENLLDSRVEAFQYTRVKVESKTKVSNNNVLDLIVLLTQKIDHMITQFTQVQNQIMGHFTTVERNQCTPRPQFSRQQKDSTSWKPRPQQEAKVPDILKPTRMVDTKASFLPCQEPHREDEFPRRDENSPNDMTFMDMIYVFQEEQVTQEHMNESKRRGEREGRL